MDFAASNFNYNKVLTHAWYGNNTSGHSRNGEQPVHMLWESEFPSQQHNHSLGSSQPVIIVELTLDWLRILSLLSLMCLFAVTTPIDTGLIVTPATYTTFLILASSIALVCPSWYVAFKRRKDHEVEASDKQTGPARVDREQPMVSGRGRIMPAVSRHNTWNASGTTFRGGLIGTFSVGQTLSRRDYTVGLICALHIELAAVRGMLDEIHVDLPVPRSDTNTYILGRMCSHNVVITCLPNGIHGPVTAATAATQMLSTFQSIRFGLMVGIGGGVPALPHQDIRLGDVVVGKPTKRSGSGGVFLCDVNFEHTRTLNKPPTVLLTALSTLRAQHLLRETRIPEFLSEMLLRYRLMRDSIRRGEDDQLFQADHKHSSPKGSCSNCNKSFVISRPQRGTESPQVHYGPIPSVARVVKDAELRDRLASKLGNLCFEMEAAGLMDNFPCLIIRGISDYADSHKNNHWHGYAAATAAAYAKELLSVIAQEEVENECVIFQLY